MKSLPIIKIPRRPARDYFLPDPATIQERIKKSSLPRSHFQQLIKVASARASRLHDDKIMVSQQFDPVKQHDVANKCNRPVIQHCSNRALCQITFIAVTDPCLPCSTKPKKGGVGNEI